MQWKYHWTQGTLILLYYSFSTGPCTSHLTYQGWDFVQLYTELLDGNIDNVFVRAKLKSHNNFDPQFLIETMCFKITSFLSLGFF